MSDRVVRLDPPGAADYLGMLLEHHIWATLALIDLCAGLPPETLELTTPGVYGTVHATLAHLVRSDAGYQRRILGEARAGTPGAEPDLATLRAEMEHQAGRWREVAGRMDEFDVTLPPEPDEDPPYPSIEHAAGLLLVQAIHHGNEHRAHVLSILGANGLPAPELSGWEYVRVTQ